MSVKVDWKKYLEENLDFVVLNKQMAKSYGKIDSEKISRPIILKQSLFVVKNNSVIKLN